MGTEEVMRMINRRAEEVARLAVTPQVLGIAALARTVDEDKRLTAVSEAASVGEIAAQGVDLPAGTRLSPRTFEDPHDEFPDPMVSFEHGRLSVFWNGSIVTVEERKT